MNFFIFQFNEASKNKSKEQVEALNDIFTMKYMTNLKTFQKIKLT